MSTVEDTEDRIIKTPCAGSVGFVCGSCDAYQRYERDVSGIHSCEECGHRTEVRIARRIQYCPHCGESYSVHSPAFGCFACAVGL